MGDGPLRVVASQQDRGIGTCVSRPVIVDWHWYYHATTAPLWALIFLLLVIFRANRNRQAWLILIPLALVLILWHTPILLLGTSEATAQTIGCLIVPGAMAWTMVWLLGHRLGSRYSSVSFFLIVAMMLAVGAWSMYYSDEVATSFALYAILYSTAVISLVAAMMLTGRCCRKRFSPKRFGLLLLVGLGVVTVGLPFSIYLAVMLIIPPESRRYVMYGLIAIPIMSAMLAAIINIINLPFLILGLNSPFYRRRLEAMFRVRQDGRVALGQSEISDSAPPA